MPYDEKTAQRVAHVVSSWKNTASKKMFGGVCHLLNGNMVCGIYRDCLILRLGEKAAGIAMDRPHTRPFDITGRPMKGWVMVEPDGFEEDDALQEWLGMARRFAETLPPK